MPTIFVPDDLLSEFRTEVLRSHGKLYGELRTEAANAIRHRTDELKRANDRREGIQRPVARSR